MAEQIAVDLLITHGLVVTLDPARRVIADGAVAMADGRIVEVGKTAALEERYQAGRVIDAGDFIVMPGLVDAHVHITAEHLTRGLAIDDAGPAWMGDWALPLYGAITPEEERAGALLSCLEMIRNGTTTFGEGGTAKDISSSVAAVEQAGLRGVLSPWTWDRPSLPGALEMGADEALARTSDAIARFHGAAEGRVRIATSCISPALCSPGLRRALKDLADEHGLTYSFHHGSTRQQVDGYLAAHNRRPFVDYAEEGILGPNVRATHMVHLDADELAALVASGTSVAHCPQTALKLGYGATTVGRFPEMIAAGVPVALGTDGVNSSDNQDMFKAMQLVAGLFKDAREDAALVPAEHAIEMATLVGARALGLDDEVGALEPGKRADLILIDRRAPELTPLIDVANALVYASDGRNVDTVIVGGTVIMEGRKVLTIDADALYAEVREMAPKLIERAGLTPRPRWPVS
jgi:cytosine/adenosine deaminase-related metal-dependent hydrolase